MLCIQYGMYGLIHFLFPVILIYLMFDSSWLPSDFILRGSLRHLCTMDEQKYIIKMHLYLDGMENTESTSC